MSDLYLLGLGLLRDRNSDHEHAIVIDGSDVIPVQALTEIELATELTLGTLCDLNFVSFGRGPASGRPYVENFLFDGYLDRSGIHAGQVDIDLELVSPTESVHRSQSTPLLTAPVLATPIELTKWLESHQHDYFLSTTLEQSTIYDRHTFDYLVPLYVLFPNFDHPTSRLARHRKAPATNLPTAV
jgi:hypothetical protein